MNKLNILLTNDDSYNSSYLHVVKDELKKIGNVYVFAPKEVMSAKSCSCTLTRGLSVIKEKENEYIIDGTPSDCVNLGNYYLKKELGIHINICSLFKDNNHHTSGLLNENGEKIDIKNDKPLFFFLTRMQDEVHRFAISTHIKKRSKDMFKSIFDDVKGIGKVKKENLIRRYPTLKDLSFATIEELTQIIPKDAAEKLLEKVKKIS